MQPGAMPGRQGRVEWQAPPQRVQQGPWVPQELQKLLAQKAQPEQRGLPVSLGRQVPPGRQR